MPREGQRGGEGGHSPDRTQTTAAACGALALAAVSCGADDMGWDQARRGAGNLWGAPVLVPQNVCVWHMSRERGDSRGCGDVPSWCFWWVGQGCGHSCLGAKRGP